MTDPRALLSRAGLSQSGAARFLGRDVRTVQRWCAPPGAPGFSPIPHWAVEMLQREAAWKELSYPRRDESAAD